MITPLALDGRTLIAPGLLRALAQHPATAPPLGLGIYRAVARTVAHATPTCRHLHGAPAIADAVALHLTLARP